MYEVELKLRADHERVRERLESLGATHVETVTQEDTYYDAPDREFAETDEALRVRRESTADGTARSFLTYKGPLVDVESKTRSEAETRVADDDATDSILTGLGYEAAATVRKARERYELGECTVTLDHVESLGEFVEVELESEVAGDGAVADVLEAPREQVRSVLRDLELDPDENIRTSYLGLLLAGEGSDF
ncbi:class IV adenylate cyclase [Halobacteriales archaeon QH_2_65_14]|nr:MAG: class IV adenylate cyclase [Halobacteriales archaeon QH_2_65_14]